jgi:effector-binding domain-containing protein
VWNFIRATKLPNPGRHVALYLRDGSIEVGAEITGPFEGNDRIHSSELPVGPVAHVAHFGPYQQLGTAHAAVGDWCEQHGHKRTGICWELYGHWQESWNNDQSQIRTDVFHLLDGQSSHPA